MYAADTTNTSIINYWYPLADVAKEVEMRTSYLGRFRRTEQAAHLLDLLSMTSDERDLFLSFFKSAASLIFAKISKLTKNVENAYEVDLNPNSDNIYKESIHYKIEWGSNMNANYKAPLDQRIMDAICWYIIYRWLMLANPDAKVDAESAAANYSSALDDVGTYSSKLTNAFISKTPRPF